MKFRWLSVLDVLALCTGRSGSLLAEYSVSRRYYATHTPITVRGEIEQTDLISEPDYEESKSKCVSKKDLTIQNAKYGILIGLIIYFILSFLGIYN